MAQFVLFLSKQTLHLLFCLFEHLKGGAAVHTIIPGRAVDILVTI